MKSLTYRQMAALSSIVRTMYSNCSKTTEDAIACENSKERWTAALRTISDSLEAVHPTLRDNKEMCKPASKALRLLSNLCSSGPISFGMTYRDQTLNDLNDASEALWGLYEQSPEHWTTVSDEAEATQVICHTLEKVYKQTGIMLTSNDYDTDCYAVRISEPESLIGFVGARQNGLDGTAEFISTEFDGSQDSALAYIESVIKKWRESEEQSGTLIKPLIL